MAYSIKQHEVQRVSMILRSLGWEVKTTVYGVKDITLTIHRELSDQLLKAAGELNIPSSPQ